MPLNKLEQRLFELTGQLLAFNEEAYGQFVDITNAEDYEVDFYGEVKPFADRVKKAADEWEPLARDWVMENKPKYLYPIQIKNTFENIEMTSVIAWQKDTKPKRFKERIKSIEYVLAYLLEQLNGSH
ncbi:DUF1798 family protein [Pseudalkalibacillus caeni]|uniref:DUF1798 family protein n=1 Tax=Exobacillus caeni TaxID=2574798 RepID=A0A5R9EYM3_9BACL|nr:DUF1798 family protein [Pseudalkalibacillus caeni]